MPPNPNLPSGGHLIEANSHPSSSLISASPSNKTMTSSSSQYVGHKVSKVRWIAPSLLNASIPTGHLVTAGYDDESAMNKLVLWKIPQLSFVEKRGAVERGLNARMVHSVSHVGSITDFCFPVANRLATASDQGRVTLFELKDNHNMRDASDTHTLNKLASLDLHTFPSGSLAPITSISVQPNQLNPEIMSAGEDGSIKFFTMETLQTQSKEKVQSYKLESSSIRSACYNDSKLVVTVTGTRMKIWERNSLDSSRKPLLSTESHVDVNCVSIHPGQPNVLVSGDSEGSIVYWDIRNLSDPYSIEKKVHDSDVWEVAFHPTQPSEVFSCSEDGTVGQSHFQKDQSSSLPPKHVRNIMTSRLSVNSLDISDDLLTYGTDNDCLSFVHVPPM